jgi:hypothetical protein
VKRQDLRRAIPASNNSLVGIVATHSLVSRSGLIPASLTRDRPGHSVPKCQRRRQPCLA